MSKICIISGSGKLPLVIGKKLSQLGNNIYYLCINNFAKENHYKNFNYKFLNLEKVSNILNYLNKNQINKIIMAGHVKRPSLKELKFDLKTLKFIKQYALQPKGDDKLLLSIVNFFEKEGFNFINWKDKCKKLFVNNNFITKSKPNKISINNLDKGLKIFKKIGRIDLSQSLVIQNSMILGIEAAEGTDELIRRCFKYKRKGDKGIVIKLSKYNQDTRFDVPVIGLNTVKLLKKYNYEGIFLEINKCIIIDKKQVIDFANKNNIFISGTKKN